MKSGGMAMAAAAVLFLGVAPARAEAVGDGLDAIFSEWIGADRPGCAAAVTRAGEVLAARAWGQAIVETGTPNTASTEFHMASVSKQFTAYAVRLLEAEGRLSLQDDVRLHVPELHDFGLRITIADLLHHTSGLRDQWELLTLQGRRHGDAFTQEDVLRVLVAQRELNFAPGERHAYSNSNYTLLAVIVERVSGRPFAEFLAERVFGPLGMSGSYVNAEVRTIRAGQAWPYAPGAGGFERRQLAYSNYGATDVRTTAADVARWLLHLDQGVIGETALVQVMSEPGRDAAGRTVAYGSGLIRGAYRGAAILEHGGIDPGFAAHLLLVPEHRFGVAVMCNVETPRAGEMARRIVDLHLDAVLTAPEPPRPTVEVASAAAEALAGLYVDEDGLPFGVEFRDGRLFAQGGVEMRPVAPNEFQMGDAPVFLVFGEGGRLTVREPTGERHARRQTGPTPPMLSAGALEPYAGDYYSPELGVVMRVEAAGDQLSFDSPGIEAPLFQPPDVLRQADVFFSPSPMGWVRFRRDAEGRIVALTTTNGRVVNLRFSRLAGPADLASLQHAAGDPVPLSPDGS